MISRRTITKGAAWAVPTIVVGAAAPLAAASSPVIITQPTGDGGGCKEPGKSFSKDYPYAYRISLDVTSGEAGTVCLVYATSPAGTVTVFENQCFPVIAGTTRIAVKIASSNSANGTARLFFTFGGATVPVAVSFGQGFHPCER